jgi:hypothetical protein
MRHSPVRSRLQLTQRSSSGQAFNFVADASHQLAETVGWKVEVDGK